LGKATKSPTIFAAAAAAITAITAYCYYHPPLSLTIHNIWRRYLFCALKA